ncbi:hypothetical protein GCM10027026_08600 [Myroides odoratimimus subsp. xuanwuensis]
MGAGLLALATLTVGTAACSQQEPDAALASAPIASETPPGPTETASASTTPTPRPTTRSPSATPSPSTAPPLRRLSASDPADDIVGPKPAHWFAPSTDLTRFVATYEAATGQMRFRITFRDLRELTKQRKRFEHSVTVANDAGPWTAVFFERSPWHGASIVIHGSTGRPLSEGGGIRTCRGASSATRADTVTLFIPVRCIARGQRPAHFSVSSSAQQVFRNAWSEPIASDELLTTRRVLTR